MRIHPCNHYPDYSAIFSSPEAPPAPTVAHLPSKVTTIPTLPLISLTVDELNKVEPYSAYSSNLLLLCTLFLTMAPPLTSYPSLESLTLLPFALSLLLNYEQASLIYCTNSPPVPPTIVLASSLTIQPAYPACLLNYSVVPNKQFRQR